MRTILVLTLMTLAACGADGEPIRPAVNGNVTLSNSGVQAGAGVSVRQGPFTIGVGF